MNLELLPATVGHERFTQRSNKFAYSVFYVITPVVETSFETPRLWSFNRFNLLSMHYRDHGPRDGSPWRPWIEKECAAQGMKLSEEDTVLLIAHPRFLGYAFNPISYWLVFERDTHLKAVLCAVHNTFGDTHNYFLAHEDRRVIQPSDMFSAKKNLYVSPFNTVPPGSYSFSFTITPEKFKSVINYYEDGVHVLNTYMGGKRAPLTSASILATLVRYPLAILLVVFRIHYQALRLYVKGVVHTLDTRPPHTEGKTTRGQTTTPSRGDTA